MKKYLMLVAIGLLSGCASWNWSSLNPWAENDNSAEKVVAEKKSSSAVSVNQYLWQASLDKLAFMGIESKNPEEGLISTFWKTMPAAENEKFKIVAEIEGRELRADALKVKVYKEIRSGEGWIKTAPSEGVQSEIEQAIIKQAKILYINDKNKE